MDTNEQIIANFLRPPSEGGAYTDEKLAALLAHAEDGKLSFWSCCCFAGIPTADHALKQRNRGEENEHWLRHETEQEENASWAFCRFGIDDAQRRTKLIPLIKSEMARRESSRSQTEVSEVVMA